MGSEKRSNLLGLGGRDGEESLVLAESERRALYFRRAFHLGRVPVLTLLFSLVLLGIFLREQSGGFVENGRLVALGAKSGALIDDLGQIWRLATANLLHKDWAHLGFNLFVLFHFGAAVENAYRSADYLVIVVASALGGMLLSYLVIGGITAGASGVAFGMLGASLVFGVKYRRLLPPRYRRVLGAAVAPTALLFFYMGLSSKGIDNWAHLGGATAGALAAGLLTPRLLAPSPDLRKLVMRRGMPLGLFFVFLALGEPLLGSHLPRFVSTHDPTLRLGLEIPAGWRSRGIHGYDNDMPTEGRASLVVGAMPWREGLTLEAVAARWVALRLEAEEEAGRVGEAELLSLRPARVGGREAVRQEVHLVVDGVPTVLAAYFFRGEDLGYWMVTARPERLPGYERVFRRILSSVRLR